MAQKMFKKSQYKKLVENFTNQDGTKDFKVVVKLFNPGGAGTWYLSELNPKTNEAFGLADIQEKELGYISIDELNNFKGFMGLGIERDAGFPENKISFEELMKETA